MTTRPTACIFCRAESVGGGGREHIVPESLWPEDPDQPPPILSPGVVCLSCNNRLSWLDQELQKALGLLKVFVTPVTKKGKPPLAVLPNAVIQRGPSGPVMYINERKSPAVLPDGRKLRPASNAGKGLRDIKIKTDGGLVRITFAARLPCHRPPVLRALHKIALEFYAHCRGVVTVMDQAFDPARSYVLSGRPRRAVLARARVSLSLGKAGHTVQLLTKEGLWQRVVSVQLCGVEFLVSVTEDLADLREIKRVQADTFVVLGSL